MSDNIFIYLFTLICVYIFTSVYLVFSVLEQFPVLLICFFHKFPITFSISFMSCRIFLFLTSEKRSPKEFTVFPCDFHPDSFVFACFTLLKCDRFRGLPLCFPLFFIGNQFKYCSIRIGHGIIMNKKHNAV